MGIRESLYNFFGNLEEKARQSAEAGTARHANPLLDPVTKATITKEQAIAAVTAHYYGHSGEAAHLALLLEINEIETAYEKSTGLKVDPGHKREIEIGRAANAAARAQGAYESSCKGKFRAEQTRG